MDVGTVRVGIARSDPDGVLATPIETIDRKSDAPAEVLRMVEELDAIEVVVGLPVALSGNRTASTEDAAGFARILANLLAAVPVRLVDERLSTVSAAAALRASGRNSRKSRPVIDQVAAVIVLQYALDFEQAAGRPAGTVVAPDEGSQADGK